MLFSTKIFYFGTHYIYIDYVMLKFLSLTIFLVIGWKSRLTWYHRCCDRASEPTVFARMTTNDRQMETLQDISECDQTVQLHGHTKHP